ncbi:MAG: siderophore-interacting protein, partial [Actinomycetota bacterium]
MSATRVRREPPKFREVAVAAVEARSPHLVGITVAGPELAGFDMGLPAASVRLLVPIEAGLVLPTWNGNEFLYEDGSRPPIRTLTPRRFDGVAGARRLGPCRQWTVAVQHDL